MISPQESPVEGAVRRALHAAGDRMQESPDLFARVRGSVEADRRRRSVRRQVVAWSVAGVAVLVAVVAATSDVDTEKGSVAMRWWILELITTAVLLVLAFGLGPLIKRFGKSYAGDVFRANPRTGKSYLVLADVAYYLIFIAFVLFTITFERPDDWPATVAGAQLKGEVARVGGILLIIGLLHSANIVMLPVIGRLLTLNRHLDEAVSSGSGGPARGPAPVAPAGGTAPAGTTTWILRLEPAPEQAPPSPPTGGQATSS